MSETEVNIIGWASVVRARNLWGHLSGTQRRELASILEGISLPVARLISTICTDPNWRQSIDERTPICPSEILSDTTTISEVSLMRVEAIFSRFYAAKDLRDLSGREAYEFAKKHSKSLSLVMCLTLVKKAKVSGDEWLIQDVLALLKWFLSSRYYLSKNNNIKFTLDSFNKAKTIIFALLKGEWIPEKPKTTKQLSRDILNDPLIRTNYKKVRALVNKAWEKDIQLYSILVAAMAQDINYTYSRNDFEEVLAYYNNHQSEISLDDTKKFLYRLKSPKFRNELVCDFSSRYSWLWWRHLRTSMRPSSNNQPPLSPTSPTSTIWDKMTLWQEARAAGISAELLAIARKNASDPRLMGSGGNRARKKWRRIGEEFA